MLIPWDYNTVYFQNSSRLTRHSDRGFGRDTWMVRERTWEEDPYRGRGGNVLVIKGVSWGLGEWLSKAEMSTVRVADRCIRHAT